MIAPKSRLPQHSALSSRLTQPTASSARHSKLNKSDENTNITSNINKSNERTLFTSAPIKPKVVPTKLIGTKLNPDRVQLDHLTNELNLSRSRCEELDIRCNQLEQRVDVKQTKCNELEAILAQQTFDHAQTIDELKRQICLYEMTLHDAGYDVVTLTKPLSIDIKSDGDVQLSEVMRNRAYALHERVHQSSSTSSHHHHHDIITPNNTPRLSHIPTHKNSPSLINIMSIAEGPSIEEFDSCHISSTSHHDHVSTSISAIRTRDSTNDRSFTENEIWAESF